MAAASEYPELPLLEEQVSYRFLREAKALPLRETDEGVVVAMADTLPPLGPVERQQVVGLPGAVNTLANQTSYVDDITGLADAGGAATQPPAPTAEPALNPNQPTHSRAAPIIT